MYSRCFFLLRLKIQFDELTLTRYTDVCFSVINIYLFVCLFLLLVLYNVLTQSHAWPKSLTGALTAAANAARVF